MSMLDNEPLLTQQEKEVVPTFAHYASTKLAADTALFGSPPAGVERCNASFYISWAKKGSYTSFIVIRIPRT